MLERGRVLGQVPGLVLALEPVLEREQVLAREREQVQVLAQAPGRVLALHN